MSWIAAGGAAATGIISGITALSQSSKAKKLEKSNVRPTYQIPKEILQNQALAEQLSTTGIQGGQYSRATQNIERAANTAVSQASDRRGALGVIGAVEKQKQDAFGNLSVQDQEQRMANIRNLMQQNQQLAGYKDKAFGYNEDARYQENAAAIRALKGASSANFNSSMNSFLSAGASAIGGIKSSPSKTPVSTDLTYQISNFMSNRPAIDASLIPRTTDPISVQQQIVSQTPKDPTEMSDFYDDGLSSLNWLKNFKR